MDKYNQEVKEGATNQFPAGGTLPGNLTLQELHVVSCLFELVVLECVKVFYLILAVYTGALDLSEWRCKSGIGYLVTAKMSSYFSAGGTFYYLVVRMMALQLLSSFYGISIDVFLRTGHEVGIN